jgi:hypothetical protein
MRGASYSLGNEGDTPGGQGTAALRGLPDAWGARPVSTVAHEVEISRRHGRRSDVALVVLVALVASVLVLAVYDGLWPPRDSTPTSHTGRPG